MDNMIMNGLYIFEKEKAHGYFYKVKKLLYDDNSDYQNIKVFDTYDMGRILMLDNVFNVSAAMEHFYHEPMVHIPLGMTEKPANVLIIGGGDFGVASHVLKHQCVNKVTMCEIDAKVVEVCRKYFPQWADTCEQDKRFQLHIEDGLQFLTAAESESFDAIIIDSTDPYGSAENLISPEFYELAYEKLKSQGVMIQIVADAYFYKNTWKKVIPATRSIFDVYAPLFMPIPFYATVSCWGLLLMGKNRSDLNPERISESYLAKIPDLKTMTADLVKGWFSLPPYIRQFFDQI